VRGFTCSASNASRPPRKERPSDDAGRLKRYREYPHCLRRADANCAPRRGGLGCATRTPVCPSFTAVPRQSRGLRNRSVDVFGARSHSRGGSCDVPQGARSEMCLVRFCFPTLCNEHPYPASFRPIVISLR